MNPAISTDMPRGNAAVIGTLPLVCPRCRAVLRAESGTLTCGACREEFRFSEGFPDLIVGERFADETSEAKMEYEETSNADLAQNYLLPLFRRLWPERQGPPRLLSLGCGTGIDVDLLNAQGFECLGIDCGKRTAAWSRREQRHRLLLANGKSLPFPDNSFDAVFCGCVFPHVGVVGDTAEVAPDCQAQRFSLAKEMTRVLKPGGRVLVSSPNRRFPLDLFHGREEGSLRPRVNWPASPFLLSVSDYARLFRDAGCAGRVQALPVTGYWGFIRSRRSLRGYVLGLPVRALFWATSKVSFLRGSPLDPWLVLLIEKVA
jgi:SAM-dependent methyltransferase